MSDYPVIRISEAARSVFYIPLLAVVEAGFLAREGFEGVLGTEPGVGADRLLQLNRGVVDVLGNTPTLSFLWLEKQIPGDLPVQVAAMNHRDGFFLIRRHGQGEFQWSDLKGATVVTSKFSLQPLASLRLCLSKVGGVTMDEINFLNDYATLDAAAQAFRDGVGDFVHLQDPLASLLVEEGAGSTAVSVGEALGNLAFSTLAMSRKFIEERPEAAEAFMRAYGATLRWLSACVPEEIASATQGLFKGVPRGVLVRSVQNCKAIGAWQPDTVIRRESYERRVDMWILAGHMKKRHPFERVVSNDLAEKIEREWKAGA